jgi:hypothetical protein
MKATTPWILLDTETTGLSKPIFTVELAAQRRPEDGLWQDATATTACGKMPQPRHGIAMALGRRD